MSHSDSEEDFESADEGDQDVQKSKKDSKSQQNISQKTKNEPSGSEKSDIPESNKVDEPAATTPPPQQSRWGSWGLSLISNASKQVASITTQVSNSITSVIESSINIPDPEELARINAEKETLDNDDKKEEETNKDDGVFKLDSLMSNVTQMSSKIVSGGLDTLEGIGKKTITILQETNPDIKNKIRGINNKPNLSEILKEAKERTDDPSPTTNRTTSFKPVSFELLFEDSKGTVFYEALEILSNQSRMKIDLLKKPLDGRALQDIEETLEEVKELCELPDIDSVDEEMSIESLESKLEAAIEDLSVKLNFQELVTFVGNSKSWLDESGDTNGYEIYSKSIECLANTCALSLGNLHKLAELLLSKDHRSTADEADSLTQLTTIYCQLLNLVASLFSSKISSLESNDENQKFVTNVFLESSTSITHIKNAFGLFIPILQIGAI